MQLPRFAVCTALIACSTLAAAGELPLYHGSPGHEGTFDRVITLRADARWVNVMSGETVKFVDAASGRSFVWRFDIPNLATFDLVAVAPRGVLTPERLTVYVAQNVRNTDDP
jgi:hypothetical protein